MTECLPSPYLLGAPNRYTKWRTGQAEAVLSSAYCDKRFLVRGAPTGFGKTLMYVAYAMLTDARACILTSTKALQRQVGEDLAESGMVEIRGLNSYECIEAGPTGRFGDVRREGYRANMGLPMMCDEAPCQSGAFCKKREGGCLYYDAYTQANNSRLLVTNYAYWMAIHKFGEGLGHFDLLILDEAHNASDELSKFVGTEINPLEIESVLPHSTKDFTVADDREDFWRPWAEHWNTVALGELEYIKAAVRENERTGGNKQHSNLNHTMLRRARDLRRIQQKLVTVANMSGEWVIEWVEDHKRHKSIKFDPVWPGAYAESNLFLHIPKIMMVSATVRPKTAGMLGIDPNDVDFQEYPSTFNRLNRPVLFSPAAPMNKNSAALGKRDWHLSMDQIIGRRPNMKGIIHTVSYPRAREVYAGSEYKTRLLMHTSENTKEVIAQFKATKEPLVLVSPVLDTGYDFPYDQARFQIIAKMPFPVTIDKIIKARMARDPGYRDYVTMVKLVQMAGRICRAEDDWGETIIIDSDFGWWFNKVGKRLAPKWFVESVKYVQFLGMPLTSAVA